MTSCEAWSDIEVMAAMVRRRGIATVIAAQDPAEAPGWTGDGLLIDLSRTGLSSTSLDALLAFAGEAGYDARRAQLFGGMAAEKLPPGAPPLHLRRPLGAPVTWKGAESSIEIAAVRHWPESLATAIRDGSLRGAAGAPFADILQIEAGEPDAGARLVADTLAPLCGGPRVHLLGLRDGQALSALLRRLDPARTAVILAGTRLRQPAFRALAAAATGWLAKALGAGEAARQLAAVTADPASARSLGVPPERIIAAPEALLDGLSAWSPVNLGLMVAVGPDALAALRTGAAALDDRMRAAPAAQNPALLLALADLWTEDALGIPRGAAAAYDPALRGWERFAGGARDRAAGPAVRPRSVEVLVAALPASEEWDDYLLLRTAEALAEVRVRSGGRDQDRRMTVLRAIGLSPEEASERIARQAIAGEEPGIVIAYRRLDAAMLGRLMALAEHRAFAAQVLRGEAARPEGDLDRAVLEAAEPVAAALAAAPAFGVDPGTQRVVRHLLAERGLAPQFVGGARANVIPMPRLAGLRRRPRAVAADLGRTPDPGPQPTAS